MPSKLKFTVLSTLIGALTHLLAILVAVGVDLARSGSGPHGYGDLMWVVGPMVFTPIGAVAGLVLVVFPIYA